MDTFQQFLLENFTVGVMGFGFAILTLVIKEVIVSNNRHKERKEKVSADEKLDFIIDHMGDDSCSCDGEEIRKDIKELSKHSKLYSQDRQLIMSSISDIKGDVTHIRDRVK